MNLTVFQERYITVMRRYPGISVQDAALRLKSSRVAVAQSGYALERKGLCKSYRRGTDQWAVLVFYLID